MTTSNHVFSALSFISFILVSVPFPWHFRARNSAICLHILWVSLSNLAFFVDSVLWDGNVVDRSPIWCDISSRLIFANYIAIPATCLCIQRRIYHVFSGPLAIDAAGLVRRRLIWDLLISVGLPLLTLVFAYLVQPNRYVILENYGCCAKYIKTAMSVVLIAALRLAVCLVSGAYGCLNMYRIWTKRRDVGSILSSSTGGFGYNHYMRLFMLTGIDMLLSTSFNIWYFTTWFPVSPWPGWNAIHKDWSHIPLFTVAELPSIPAAEVPRWVNMVYGLLFFVFFGASAEARKYYASILRYGSGVCFWKTLFSRESLGSVHVNLHSASDNSGSPGSSCGTDGTIVAEPKFLSSRALTKPFPAHSSTISHQLTFSTQESATRASVEEFGGQT